MGGGAALHIAAWRGKKQSSSILIELGININIQDKYGWTALHSATRWGHTEVVSVLLKAKIDHTLRATKGIRHADGETALYVAKGYGHVDTIKLLSDVSY